MSQDLPKAEWRPASNYREQRRRPLPIRPGRHPFQPLNLGLFRHLQGIVDLDPQVSHGPFNFVAAAWAASHFIYQWKRVDDIPKSAAALSDPKMR